MMFKALVSQSMVGALVAVLICGGSNAADATPDPKWSSVVAVAEDPTDTLNEILPDQQWQRVVSGEGITLQHAAQVVASRSGQAYWAGFSLYGLSAKDVTYWLSLQSPTLDTAQLWWRKSGEDWTKQVLLQELEPFRFGSGQLFAVWPLTLPAEGHIDVLVRTQGVNRVQFPLVLQTPEVFMAQQRVLFLLMGLILAVPWVVVLYVMTLMPSLYNPSLPIFIAMAVCETVGAVWVSGLMCTFWPWLDRLQAAWIGSVSYGLLMALSVHHARAFLRTAQHDPRMDRWLRRAAGCWWIVLPLLAVVYSNWMRSALLYLGAFHAIALLLLACRTYRRYPRAYIAMYVCVWVVYLLSVLVYWLFRWFEWPLITTLGAQFLQGAVVATLLGWSACMQVLQHRHALQRRLQMHSDRSRLYAAAQHDLWQPLQSMQLYAKSLVGASVHQQQHLLKGLQLASVFVDDFMHSLRYLAHEKPKPLQPHQFQAHSLPLLLGDVLKEFEPLAQMRGVQLRCRLSSETVWVEPALLKRMLRNLLSNALRYGASGGKVLVGTRKQGDVMWLWCMDKGDGMTTAQLQACFEAFDENADAAHIPQSLGLGLFSVKQLAWQMDTPIRLLSQAGKGTAIGVGLRLTSPRNT